MLNCRTRTSGQRDLAESERSEVLPESQKRKSKLPLRHLRIENKSKYRAAVPYKLGTAYISHSFLAWYLSLHHASRLIVKQPQSNTKSWPPATSKHSTPKTERLWKRFLPTRLSTKRKKWRARPSSNAPKAELGFWTQHGVVEIPYPEE